MNDKYRFHARRFGNVEGHFSCSPTGDAFASLGNARHLAMPGNHLIWQQIAI